jgi:hypothetical protein
MVQLPCEFNSIPSTCINERSSRHPAIKYINFCMCRAKRLPVFYCILPFFSCVPLVQTTTSRKSGCETHLITHSLSHLIPTCVKEKVSIATEGLGRFYIPYLLA